MFHPKGTSFGRREIDDGKRIVTVAPSGLSDTFTGYLPSFHQGVVVFSVR